VQAEGKLSVTGADGALTPVPLIAVTVNVYVPDGTPAKVKPSTTGSDSTAEIVPETFSCRDDGVPPPTVFVHDKASVSPLAVPSKPTGLEGANGTFTKIRISLDGPLRRAPDCECTRT
jgi:hypothetical protein